MPIGVTGDFVPLGSFKIIDGKDIGGAITGSDISASNSLFVSTSESSSGHTNNNVVLVNTATGELYHTGSYGSGGGGTTPTLQEVMGQGETTTIALTSSADISSSVDIKGDNGFFASDVTAVDDIFIGDRLMHYGNTSTQIGFGTDFIYFSASKFNFGAAITTSADISSSNTVKAKLFQVDGVTFADSASTGLLLGDTGGTIPTTIFGTSITAYSPITASIISASDGITGSLYGTASFADDATSASYALDATSASFAVSASEVGIRDSQTNSNFAVTFVPPSQDGHVNLLRATNTRLLYNPFNAELSLDPSGTGSIYASFITASTISASNSLFISTSLSGSHTSSNVVLINTATGELYHTSSYGAGGSGTGIPGGGNTDIQFNDGGGAFGGTSSFTFEKDADASIFVDGPITASGDISSSNSLFISTSLSGSHTNSSVVLINTLTGELYHTSSYGSGVPTLQQVMSQGETTSVALTSSADISSSANIKGRDGFFTRDVTAVDDMFLGDKLMHYGDPSTLIGFGTDFIYFSASRLESNGAITASGDISSSNSLFISTSESSSAHTSNNVVLINTATGELYHTGSYGSGGGVINTLQEVMGQGSSTSIALTSSADISSSGNLIINDVTADDYKVRVGSTDLFVVQGGTDPFEGDGFQITFGPQLGQARGTKVAGEWLNLVAGDNNAITASSDITASGDLIVNNITSSNISSSGNVSGSEGHFAEKIFLNGNNYFLVGRESDQTPRNLIGLTSGDNIQVGNTNIPISIKSSNTITLDASSVSSSGDLFISTSLSSSHTNNNVLLINTATGEIYHTGSYGSGGGSGTTPTLQQVMDEGSITSTAITASVISASEGITGSLLGTATSINVGNSDDSSTYYPVMALDSGDQALKRDNGITFNTSTNTLNVENLDSLSRIFIGTSDIELRGDANNLLIYNGGLQTAGAITSSGDISSSGDLKGDELVIHSITDAGLGTLFSIDTNGLATFDSLTVAGTVNLNGNSNYGNSAADQHTFTGNITASNDISASGNLFGTTIVVEDEGVLLMNNNEVTIGSSAFPNSFRGTSTFFAHSITSSADISASGDLDCNNISASGDLAINGIANVSASIFDAEGGGVVTGYANGGNNRVITSTGTSTIHAEGGLLFDTSTNLLEVGASQANRVTLSGANGTIQSTSNLTVGNNSTQTSVNALLQFAPKNSGYYAGIFIDNDTSNTFTADGRHIGEIIEAPSNSSLTANEIVYLRATTTAWASAKADIQSTSTPLLAFTVETATNNKAMSRGYVRIPATKVLGPAPDIGQLLYLSTGSAGSFQTLSPKTVGHIARSVGYPINSVSGRGGAITSYVVYFNPSNDYVIL